MGFAAIVVAAGFATMSDATAELATPVVVALAVAGLLTGRGRLRRPASWGLAAVLVVFGAYAAPIVLSGEATFAGYVKLDDTATWMALTDRVMEHGRSLEGLAPSSYEATLAVNLAEGYPVGVFLPLGVATALVGEDVAWTVQPYMAFAACLLAAALWSLAAPLVRSPRLRFAVVAVAAQPALLFGYYLWGGIKEVVAAAMIATAAALVPGALRESLAPRTLAPLALVGAALLGVLSPAGAIWLAPALALALLVASSRLALRTLGLRAALFLALAAALAVPALVPGVLPPTSSPLDAGDARGNLFGPLGPERAAGIWLAEDFRAGADPALVNGLLIGFAAAAAAIGGACAVRARAWGILGVLASAALAGGTLYALGSPWVGAKALATASFAVPLLGGIGSVALLRRGLRLEAAALAAVLVLGVAWSNALAYSGVSLAPREQLAELQRIGKAIGGQGPTLMTEYQPYGVRHFLRAGDPEGASELRRRGVPLRDGTSVPKGEWADTDALDPEGLRAYDTLVLRRSPEQSRPPSPYRLVHRGEHYELWRRDPERPEPLRRLGLGSRHGVADGTPSCAAVRRLAAVAGPRGALLAAPAQRSRRVALDGWRGRVQVPRTGSYEAWVGGSLGSPAELLLGGTGMGRVDPQVNNAGLYVSLGDAGLAAGEHVAELQVEEGGLAPGARVETAPPSSLVLRPAGAGAAPVRRIAPARARTLCGRTWDWIEALPPG